MGLCNSSKGRLAFGKPRDLQLTAVGFGEKGLLFPPLIMRRPTSIDRAAAGLVGSKGKGGLVCCVGVWRAVPLWAQARQPYLVKGPRACKGTKVRYFLTTKGVGGNQGVISYFVSRTIRCKNRRGRGPSSREISPRPRMGLASLSQECRSSSPDVI